MVKIQFWLRKQNAKEGNLEHVIINSPKKVTEGKLVGMFVCEVHLPETERENHSIYADNPLDALCFASEFVKVYLQGLVNSGYTISESESKEIWKLEKKDPQVNLQEKMSELKNNKNLPEKDKQQILGIMKETFGKIPHMKNVFNN